MYFYQSNREVCQYISEHELWVLGRITGIHNKTTHKNEKMLEPLWRKYDKNIEGISIFYSKMDAVFYSTYLAQRFNEKWDVYPLDDFNIKEMMMNNQQIKKTDDYYLLLHAGLWANKEHKIISSNYHLAQVTIPAKYNPGIITEDSEHPILQIPQKITDEFCKIWRKRFPDFINHTKSLCSYDIDYLKEQSLIAYNRIKLKESSRIDDCVYMATWENSWIFCNPENLNLIK